MSSHPTLFQSGCGVTPLRPKSVGHLARGLLASDEAAIKGALDDLRQRCAETEGDCLISCEDFAGDLPGRTSRRRIYPRLLQNLRTISDAFPEDQVRFYFFRRAPDPWLRSAYVQLLKHRTRFRSFQGYMNFLKGVDGLWDDVLARARGRLGPALIEIPYKEDPGFSTIAALGDAIAGRDGAVDPPPELARPNGTPAPEIVAVLERINASGASTGAQKAAKATLLKPPAPMPRPRRTWLRAKTPVWPPAIGKPDWLDPALAPLWGRVVARHKTQSQPDLLPAVKSDLAPLRSRLVAGEPDLPRGGRAKMDNQTRILAHRLDGYPELCHLLGLTISYLRRNTDHTAKASDLFQRLWAEEHVLLLGVLPARWLISSLQTFMDHGTSDAQRQIGAGGFFFANTLKLYETERAHEGLAPNQTYANAAPATKSGFAGLDRFRLGGSDLAVNTTAALLELAAQDDTAGRVLHEFLLRAKQAQTAFSRMDASRVAHDVDNPQFADCWSFVDAPKQP